MVKTKHPQTRAERLRLSEKKEHKIKLPASKVGRRKRLEVREKEAENELALAINNFKG